MGGLILVEGLDLAGKSTLVSALVRHLQATGVGVRRSRNSLCPENPIGALTDQLRSDPGRTRLEGACLYRAAHEWDLRHFQPPESGVHVQDSCWLRSLAYEQARGNQEFVRMWMASLPRCPRFDGALFLTASLEERQRRFGRRIRNDYEDALVFTDPARFLLLERRLRQASRDLAGAVELDTTGLQPDEVLEAALGLLGWARVAA